MTSLPSSRSFFAFAPKPLTSSKTITSAQAASFCQSSLFGRKPSPISFCDGSSMNYFTSWPSLRTLQAVSWIDASSEIKRNFFLSIIIKLEKQKIIKQKLFALFRKKFKFFCAYALGFRNSFHSRKTGFLQALNHSPFKIPAAFLPGISSVMEKNSAVLQNPEKLLVKRPAVKLSRKRESGRVMQNPVKKILGKLFYC